MPDGGSMLFSTVEDDGCLLPRHRPRAVPLSRSMTLMTTAEPLSTTASSVVIIFGSFLFLVPLPSMTRMMVGPSHATAASLKEVLRTVNEETGKGSTSRLHLDIVDQVLSTLSSSLIPRLIEEGGLPPDKRLSVVYHIRPGGGGVGVDHSSPLETTTIIIPCCCPEQA